VPDGLATPSPWRTSRLRIEQLRPEHAEALFEALDDPRVGAFVGGAFAESSSALAARIARQTAGPPADRVDERWWNFVVAVDGVGTVGTLQATLHGDWAEIAYLFAPRAWGRGLATEGVTWLVEHLRSQRAREVWATTDPDNQASSALLRRCGFTLTSLDRRTPASYDPGDLVFVRDLAVDAD
jgi:RimJ/RimL family protein N-acetyltransferase